jgi:3-hydroxybutyryl-CoA dehydrogenase
MTKMPQTVGVLGAGTMGAGIAQLAAQAGARTLLYDPEAAALERGIDRIRSGVEKAAAKGRADAGAAELVSPVASLDPLAGCELVIEAVPESLELKRSLFSEVAAVAGEQCVLATNTSSLSVTEIAAGVPGPERVVGMHFFNPAPVMKLLEVVAGDASDERSLAVARSTGEAMGKHVIEAADVVGFLVNRCNRPFGLEALRIVQEGLATVEQVDRIVRMGGGYRMGPFELQDLVGIDVGFGIAKSFYEQSFGEPRWQPSPLAGRLVAAGRYGRKTGRGWYEHPYTPEDPPAEPLPARTVLNPPGATPRDGAPDPLTTGYFALPGTRLVELTGARSPAAETYFASLGLHVERVGDAPGLVLGRIVCQLVNEACFAVGEGVGSEADVDAGMKLGLNHPRGPFEWLALIGAERVLEILDALRAFYGEERYRAAPLLRRRATGATS